MAGRGRKPAVPRKKANGYKMPGPIPCGEVIIDTIGKKKWRIGSPIAVGGFGEIYSACDHENASKGGNYPFVVKIEPHENGPLFVEKHFYIRNANKDDIAKFAKSKKLSTFGMPTYFGNGSHECNGVKYRYLVLERYGKDLWNLFLDNGRTFPTTTVFQIGLQMLDVLEYIHSRGYVHADIKGANILLGLKKGTENQAYLMDFGLATRVNEKEFKPDPKCAHNGTIEYTSRDAHLGVATMRGDLEILGYNMLQWIVGELPWEKCLAKPKTVQDMKEAFMKSVRSNISKQYTNVPDSLIKFFEYINTLKPKDLPDYTKCRQFFESYLKSEGKLRNSKLDFTLNKKGKKNKVVDQDSDDDEAAETYNGDSEKPVKKPKAVKKVTQLNGEVAKTKRVKKLKEETPVKDDNSGESVTTPKERKVRKYKAKSPVNNDESDDSDETNNGVSEKTVKKPKTVEKVTKLNSEVAKAKRGRKPKEETPVKDDSSEESETTPKERKVRKCTVKSPVKIDESDDSDSNQDSITNNKKEDGDVAKPKRGRKPIAKSPIEIDDSEDTDFNPDSGSKNSKQKDFAKPVRGKKLKIDTSSSMEDDENEEPDPDYSLEIVPRRLNRAGKRKSMEPSVVVNVKKTKMAPKATPPAKKNHTNIGTQTSTERPKRSPRQVSFNSPICQLISDKKPLSASIQSANSSGDIFEDSFVIEEKKVKPKKKLLSDEVVTVKVEKKVTVKSKGKSWKSCPSVK